MATGSTMHTISEIDYRKIADAKDFYTSKGFSHISVPWIIGFESYSATRPPDRPEFYTLDGYLNASAEQSFIELMLEKQKLTRHLAITPCFRYEPVLDELHHRYFLKLELIDTDTCEENLARMMDSAREFFVRFLPVKVVETGSGAFDICDDRFGIELGSYGIRKFKEFRWIYGTGLALPRLDTVLKKYTEKENGDERI